MWRWPRSIQPDLAGTIQLAGTVLQLPRPTPSLRRSPIPKHRTAFLFAAQVRVWL
jgi:hypothetical protein